MRKKSNVVPTPANRMAALEQRRTLKMAESAHAYVRGSTEQFYEWLSERGARAVPAGPNVWICGDCHSGNLGPLADAEGNIHVQMRDFDQTVIGNPHHDLIRLALSLASAARGSALPGVTTAHMLEQMMVGYQTALSGPHGQRRIQSDKPESIKIVMRSAVRRTWKHLSKERLEDIKPTIPLGERFWPLEKAELQEIKDLVAHEHVQQLVTMLKSRKSGAAVELLDAAYWMKGCSSLGKLRFAVLVNVQGRKSKSEEFCLIDIKQANPAAAPTSHHAKMPKDNAMRVVEGARHLSPALGERMAAAKLRGQPVVLRELMPQDLKLNIDQLSREEAVSSARYLAEVVGKAHARQMDSETRKALKASYRVKKSARLNAPSWLWSSVVELAARHESAYLQHCRRYALARSQAAIRGPRSRRVASR